MTTKIFKCFFFINAKDEEEVYNKISNIDKAWITDNLDTEEIN